MFNTQLTISSIAIFCLVISVSHASQISVNVPKKIYNYGETATISYAKSKTPDGEPGGYSFTLYGEFIPYSGPEPETYSDFLNQPDYAYYFDGSGFRSGFISRGHYHNEGLDDDGEAGAFNFSLTDRKLRFGPSRDHFVAYTGNIQRYVTDEFFVTRSVSPLPGAIQLADTDTLNALSKFRVNIPAADQIYKQQDPHGLARLELWKLGRITASGTVQGDRRLTSVVIEQGKYEYSLRHELQWYFGPGYHQIRLLGAYGELLDSKIIEVHVPEIKNAIQLFPEPDPKTPYQGDQLPRIWLDLPASLSEPYMRPHWYLAILKKGRGGTYIHAATYNGFLWNCASEDNKECAELITGTSQERAIYLPRELPPGQYEAQLYWHHQSTASAHFGKEWDDRMYLVEKRSFSVGASSVKPSLNRQALGRRRSEINFAEVSLTTANTPVLVGRPKEFQLKVPEELSLAGEETWVAIYRKAGYSYFCSPYISSYITRQILLPYPAIKKPTQRQTALKAKQKQIFDKKIAELRNLVKRGLMDENTFQQYKEIMESVNDGSIIPEIKTPAPLVIEKPKTLITEIPEFVTPGEHDIKRPGVINPQFSDDPGALGSDLNFSVKAPMIPGNYELRLYSGNIQDIHFDDDEFFANPDAELLARANFTVIDEAIDGLIRVNKKNLKLGESITVSYDDAKLLPLKGHLYAPHIIRIGEDLPGGAQIPSDHRAHSWRMNDIYSLQHEHQLTNPGEYEIRASYSEGQGIVVDRLRIKVVDPYEPNWPASMAPKLHKEAFWPQKNDPYRAYHVWEMPNYLCEDPKFDKPPELRLVKWQSATPDENSDYHYLDDGEFEPLAQLQYGHPFFIEAKFEEIPPDPVYAIKVDGLKKRVLIEPDPENPLLYRSDVLNLIRENSQSSEVKP